MSLWISWGELALNETASTLASAAQKTHSVSKVSTVMLYQPVDNMCVYSVTYCFISPIAC